MFLYCLVLVLNVSALDVARVEGLRAAATFYWMGCLLGGPHEPPATEEDARERRDAWRGWRGLVDHLALDARVRAEAHSSLEARYFGGRDVLFADAAAAWATHVELVECLAGLAEVISAAQAETPARRKSGAATGRATPEGRAGALASQLADDARVKAFEILGERERAVGIMERRLRS